MTTRDTQLVHLHVVNIILLLSIVTLPVFTNVELCNNFILTEQLNQAARHRNVYFDTVGGDPYGE